MRSRVAMTLFRRRLAAAMATAVPLMGGAGLTLRVTLPALAAPPALGETVTMSGLDGFSAFQLPDGGRRLTDEELASELTAQLKKYAAESKISLQATEMVAWESPTDDAKDLLKYTCLGAGMDYKESSGDRFTARSTGGDKVAVVGFWTRRDGRLILAWGGSSTKKEKATAEPSAGEILPDAPAKNVPASTGGAAQGTGRKIAPPDSMVGGTWTWTTIGGVQYVDKTTGRIAEPSGMSAKFSFRPDGGYEYFFYIRQQTYSLVSEATTNEKGKATFYDNGTVLLTPTTGHYKGNTGSRLIDREMTAAERKARLFYWEWRTEEGKKQLYFGPTRNAMSRFKRS